ncbi:hypothetical protein [Actinoplanes sp. NPDC023714]|uniref:hypothetical protein n=1 Tax=Actinoplanes sp. NPDC023714 TaxID=3154322 RepID=UPI0033ED0D9D
MPDELTITGPIVLIRMRALVLQRATRVPATPAQEGLVVAATGGGTAEGMAWTAEEFALERANVKAELTGICRQALGSGDVEVSELTVRSGSLEVVIVIAATIKLVQDFGSLAQGIREISRLVPGPVARYVRNVSSAALGSGFTAEMGPARVEMQEGMLSARQMPPSRTGNRRRRDRPPTRRSAAEPERAAREKAEPERAERERAERERAEPGRAEPERAGTLEPGSRLLAYLLISHALLTIALIATALIVATRP